MWKRSVYFTQKTAARFTPAAISQSECFLRISAYKYFSDFSNFFHAWRKAVLSAGFRHLLEKAVTKAIAAAAKKQ